MLSTLGRSLLVFVFALFWAATASAGTEPGRASVRVTIHNVSARGGMMRLGLYTEQTYGDDSALPVASLDLPATAPTQNVEFTNVPPGTYAIEVLQDFNFDGKMDFSWLGLPLKPYGFSRDARVYISRPDFARVKIALDAGVNAPLTIHLRNSE
ncbi:MAG TPA: DUF2141 domain-containing protein [Rhizomicrobium sp.]|nr:DUF2141 domain-containing protein [Rhizomicrobium sp.]